jgi:hypothetical protein
MSTDGMQTLIQFNDGEEYKKEMISFIRAEIEKAREFQKNNWRMYLQDCISQCQTQIN